MVAESSVSFHLPGWLVNHLARMVDNRDSGNFIINIKDGMILGARVEQVIRPESRSGSLALARPRKIG